MRGKEGQNLRIFSGLIWSIIMRPRAECSILHRAPNARRTSFRDRSEAFLFVRNATLIFYIITLAARVYEKETASKFPLTAN